MHIISKIFLFILSSLCLFFLVFFTFIIPGYSSTIDSNYDFLQSWTYKINWEFPNYKIEELENQESENILKLHNFSIWNNIYYYNGTIEEKWENEIHLWEWIYYIDVNSLDFNKIFFIKWAKISTNGPGWFVINTTHRIQRSILSLSSKLEVELIYKSEDSNNWTYVDIYPNMYLMYNPILNKQIINADLLRIQNVQYLDMVNSQLYEISHSENWDKINTLHPDIQKYIFYNSEENYDFINNVFSFKKYQQKKYIENYRKLSQNNIYNFPWEKYIINYYSYFLNDQKRKAYYKNSIIRDLIITIQSNKSDIDYSNILTTLEELKSIDIDEYNNMLDSIYHYYENILYSQYASSNKIINFSNLINKINNENNQYKYTSLLTLRNIYEKYHNLDIKNFHKNLNIFINQHEVEMNMSIYDENHRIHNYFLFFLQYILVADFNITNDHNTLISLFTKYLEIKNIFIEKWDDNTKKTALFDNAQLLKVFIEITKVNFFQADRDKQKLLILLDSPTLSNDDFSVLYKNLKKILDFYDDYKYFIENSNNRKDTLLALSYNKYSKDLNEYYNALTDYNKYQLNNTIVDTPDFSNNKKDELSIEKITEYLKQFIWVSSLDTNILIKNYAYCIQPDIEHLNDIQDNKWYCYKVSNLNIEWYTFEFIITPAEKNTITYLKYIDYNWVSYTPWINYIMDNIKFDMENKFDSSLKADRDKYDFQRFFLNNFIYTDANTTDNETTSKEDEILKNKFTPPSSENDNITVRKLKLALLNNNSPLVKIREFITISYNYLIIDRVNDSYNIHIFPSDFTLNIAWNRTTNVFTWKFAWKYEYEWSHTFSEVELYIKNPKKNNQNSYLLDWNSLKIEWIFEVINIKDVLSKSLYNFDKIESIYTDLKDKVNNQKITITYKISDNTVIFISWNTEIILFTWWNIKFTHNSIVKQWRFSQIWEFLNTLP